MTNFLSIKIGGGYILYLKIACSIGLMALAFRFFPNRIMEIITSAAVIVALLKNQLLQLYFRPRLRIYDAERPNGYSKIVAKKQNYNDMVFGDVEIAVMGLEVRNEGVGNAENVQLLFTGIESNAVENFSRYKSIPFYQRWTSRERIIKSLPAGTSATLPIGEISSETFAFSFDLYERPVELVDISWSQNNPAIFKFEAVAIADNASTFRAIITIHFSGEYVKDLRIDIA